MTIQYKPLSVNDLKEDLLDDFNRYQIVTNAWFPVSQGQYVLKHQPVIEDWSINFKRAKISKLCALLEQGGKLFAAYDRQKLVGFSAIDGFLIGSEKQYVELKQLHVSRDYRGQHIGRTMFQLCAEAAKSLGAKKLYIVSNASEESQIAYQKLGCVYTSEFIPELYEESPEEVHLEYTLT